MQYYLNTKNYCSRHPTKQSQFYGVFGFLVSITHNSKMLGPITKKIVWIFITLFLIFISITHNLMTFL